MYVSNAILRTAIHRTTYSAGSQSRAKSSNRTTNNTPWLCSKPTMRIYHRSVSGLVYGYQCHTVKSTANAMNWVYTISFLSGAVKPPTMRHPNEQALGVSSAPLASIGKSNEENSVCAPRSGRIRSNKPASHRRACGRSRLGASRLQYHG